MGEVLTETERVRRREHLRDSKAALTLGLSLSAYTAQRDALTCDWVEFFHSEMDKLQVDDPMQVVPQALARLQERVVAEARSTAATVARDEVAKMLRKAIAS